MDDEISASMASIDPILNVPTFANALQNKAAESNFKKSIGSVTAKFSALDTDELFNASVAGLKGDRLTGVTPDHLSKIWKIDLPTARRTLNITSQLKKQDTAGEFLEIILLMIGCFVLKIKFVIVLRCLVRFRFVFVLPLSENVSVISL